MTIILLLMGAPGSGKGTQAKRLESSLHLPHISTGDLFRKNISENTPLGQKVKEVMAAGKYVDDQLVLELLFDRIAQPDCVNGYILDGFPRTFLQVEALEKYLMDQKIQVINIEVPDEIIINRATGRRVCQDCHRIFNISLDKITDKSSCPHCGGRLIQRPDDRSEAVEERLKIYREQTHPIIEYYRKKGWLAVVDGSRSPDQVFDTIQMLLHL